ncbi:MAG: PEP-utilizing enzyme [Acidimicrobiales bacterium]
MTIRWIKDHRGPRTFPVWTRALAADLVSGPVTPLGWDLLWSGAIVPGWRDALVDTLGMPPTEVDADDPEIFGVFGGFVYLNASVLRVLAGRIPDYEADHFDQLLGLTPPSLPPTQMAGWHRNRRQSEGTLRSWVAETMTGSPRRLVEAGRVLAAEAVDERPDLRSMSDTEVLDRALALRPLCRALAQQHALQTLGATIPARVLVSITEGTNRPEDLLCLLGGIGEMESMSPLNGGWALSRLLASSDSMQAVLAAGEPLADVVEWARRMADPEPAAFVAGLDAMLDNIGYRSIRGWDLAGPTWASAPEPLVALAQSLAELSSEMDPRSRVTAAVEQAARRLAELTADEDPASSDTEADEPSGRSADEPEEAGSSEADRDGPWGVDLSDPALDGLPQLGAAAALSAAERDELRAARAAIVPALQARSLAAANVSRIVAEMQAAVAELGHRAADRGDVRQPDDISLLFVDEAAYYADGGLSTIGEIVEARRAHLINLRASEPAPVIDRTDRSEPTPPRPAGRGLRLVPSPDDREIDAATVVLEAGASIRATPVAAGRFEGRARVITSPLEVHSLPNAGDVVIIPTATAVWLPILAGAGAVVVESTGLLDHAAVFGRELEIPVVVGARSATTSIEPGATVMVDGTRGTVTVTSAADYADSAGA